MIFPGISNSRGRSSSRIRRTFSLPFTVARLAVALVLTSVAPATAIVTVDQEPVADRYPSGLRVETFLPVGQTFVPTVSWHLGVELLLSMSCMGPLPPAIYTVHLRENSLTGPVLATGTTQPFVCPALSEKEWVEILFEEPVALVPGDSYFLTLTTANIAGFWWRAGLNPYPDGEAWVSSSIEPNFDWGFRTLANIVDAFRCYDATTLDDFTGRPGLRVQLSDALGDSVARVGRGAELCVSIDRYGEGIAEPDASLLCYDIKHPKRARDMSKRPRRSDGPRSKSASVQVTNEFGVDTELIVRRPKRLCVPTTFANADQQHLPGDPAELTLDHFKCYGADVNPNQPRRFPSLPPELLCGPVDKNDEGIFDPATHLACYDVDRLGESRPQDLNLDVRVSNQFGEDQHFHISKPTTVCVPSTTEIVEPGCRGRCDTDPVSDPGRRIVINDPIFFDLPINSLRYAVSGYDRGTDLCITAIWSLRSARDQSRHCDDFGPLFPYVVIAPGEPAGCWQYGTDVELVSAEGCVDWAAFNSPVIPARDTSSGHSDEVDLKLELTSDVWSGTVYFNGHKQPKPR